MVSLVSASIVDPHWFHADPAPIWFHADPDPNPAFYVNANPDPDPVPDLDPRFLMTKNCIIHYS